MKEKILELLKNSDDFISGQTICEKLGVSRTAVWKNINALKKKAMRLTQSTIKAISWCGNRIL